MATPTPIVATVTTSTVVFSTVYVTPSPSCTPSLAAEQSSQQVVSIAIPIALLTVFTVVIVVVVGVVIYIRRGRGRLLSNGVVSLASTSETTYTHYVNTGGAQIADSSAANTYAHRGRAVTIKAVENELYQLSDNR